MTPPVALMASVPPPASTPSAPANDAGTNSSTNASRPDFNKPLAQARHALAQQSTPARTTPSKSAPDKSTKTGAKGDGAHVRANDKDDDKDDGGKVDQPKPDAATAMLALLGQSMPASAAATPVAAPAGGDDEGEETTAAVTVTSGGAAATALAATSANTIALLGAAQNAAQPQAANAAHDFTQALDGVKDKTLSMQPQGDDEGDSGNLTETAAATTTSSTSGDASGAALQALSGATQDTHSDSHPLDALRALAAPLMQQAPNANAQAAQVPHTLTMQSAVNTPAFGQELGQQVAWIGGQNVKEANIRLHPEDLGELNVKVSVKQDHVDVAFIAQHPQAVHAVQQTLSQLDSMLAHHGLSLGQAMVGQGNTGQGSAQAGTSGGSSSGGESGLAEGVGELASAVAPVVKAVGLVDMFA